MLKAPVTDGSKTVRKEKIRGELVRALAERGEWSIYVYDIRTSKAGHAFVSYKVVNHAAKGTRNKKRTYWLSGWGRWNKGSKDTAALHKDAPQIQDWVQQVMESYCRGVDKVAVEMGLVTGPLDPQLMDGLVESDQAPEGWDELW